MGQSCCSDRDHHEDQFTAGAIRRDAQYDANNAYIGTKRAVQDTRADAAFDAKEAARGAKNTFDPSRTRVDDVKEAVINRAEYAYDKTRNAAEYAAGNTKNSAGYVYDNARYKN